MRIFVKIFETKEEAEKANNNVGGTIRKLCDGFWISNHSEKCCCGMCMSLSNIDTWVR